MAFVAQGGGGREEEGAEQHGGDEGQAEEREGMSGEEDAVAGGEGRVVGRAELARGKDGHDGRFAAVSVCYCTELFWTDLDCAVLLEVRLVCLSVRAGAVGS